MIAWKLLAAFFLLAAGIGTLLPVVPTVPFLLLAAAAASRGWPELDKRLTAHPVYGRFITNWRERGAVPRAGKWWATIGMSTSCVFTWWAPLPAWFQIALTALFACVAVWIWTRPEA